MSLDGADFSNALLGKKTAVRRAPLFWEYGRNTNAFSFPQGKDRSPNVAIREGKWKLLINADSSGAELYDLTRDVAEQNDLATKESAVTERLSRASLDWRKTLP